MKRLNPNTNKPFKYGDVREDGFVFVDYRKTRPLKKDGFFQENWLNQEKFKERRIFSIAKRFEWRQNNLEYSLEYSKQHSKNKANLYAKKTAKRRAAKLQRTPHWLTDDDAWMIEQAYELAALRTKMLGFPWHVDHVIPLQGRTVSGLHVPTNLQAIPGPENVRKSNRFTDWG